MSHQIEDIFFWNDEKWVFLAAEDIYSLFDPECYGLSPTSIRTDCWKGFVIQFTVRNRELILDELWVYCENGIYPKINGIAADSSAPSWVRVVGLIFKLLCPFGKNMVGLDEYFRHYKNIGKRLHYSGTITIGQTLIEEYGECAFMTPGMYERVYKLDFQDGIYLSCSDICSRAESF